MINYAHRGASERSPENTMAAFYMAMEMGANGIETDVQRTSDNKLVLFHDDTMKRIVGIDRPVTDFKYEELLELDFGSYKSTRYRNEKIVLLEDFLKYFSAKEIFLAIEVKLNGLERDILSMIDAFKCRERVTITSFNFEHLTCIRNHDKEIPLGYLTEYIDDKTLRILEDNHIEQICPRVGNLTKERVMYAKQKGFNVRGWDVKDTDLMKHAIICGVDGMTVNFPDKLNEFIVPRKIE